MQGFNMGRYVPPELEGLQSFNQASNKKFTRNSDGSQTVRFECPFAIWCTTCQPETIIAQGVRFNAHKSKIGNYFSTPIWAFKIKHTVCGGWIEVRTDPKNAEYIVAEGGRRRDYGETKIAIEGESDDIGPVEIGDVLGSLEKKRKVEEQVNTQHARVLELEKRATRDWADPYEMNKKIRRDFRIGRRERAKDRLTGQALQDKFGLAVDVLPLPEMDAARVKYVDFESNDFKATTFASKAMSLAGGKKETEQIRAGSITKVKPDFAGNTRSKVDPFVQDRDWALQKRRKHEPSSDAGFLHSTQSENKKSTLIDYDSD